MREAQETTRKVNPPRNLDKVDEDLKGFVLEVCNSLDDRHTLIIDYNGGISVERDNLRVTITRRLGDSGYFDISDDGSFTPKGYKFTRSKRKEITAMLPPGTSISSNIISIPAQAKEITHRVIPAMFSFAEAYTKRLNSISS